MTSTPTFRASAKLGECATDDTSIRCPTIATVGHAVQPRLQPRNLVFSGSPGAVKWNLCHPPSRLTPRKRKMHGCLQIQTFFPMVQARSKHPDNPDACG